MPRFACLVCGGRYQAVLPDGMRYFHQCPPVTEVEVTRSGAPLVVPLDQVRPTDEVRVRRAGVIVRTLVSAIAEGDVRLGDRQVPRPNARDENVVPDPEGKGEGRPKRDGPGRVEVER